MKKGFRKFKITPITDWDCNVPQQIRERLRTWEEQTDFVYTSIDYCGNWNGLEYDSAIIHCDGKHIDLLKTYFIVSRNGVKT